MNARHGRATTLRRLTAGYGCQLDRSVNDVDLSRTGPRPATGGGEAHHIGRSFRFRNFRDALTFLSQYPRIDSRLRSLEVYTQIITAPPPS
jgi:hypothetical protein